MLYYYTKKNWYYEYFRISCDFGAELDHFSPKFHILWTIGNILYTVRCILTYKYNNYFPISRDYYTDLTPNN